ncbi:hypothetical protein B566_EDAN019320 [Ephemera danica]|nr:hypothetical protein B566_EDAN019320 [Ephemera danica]
MEDGEEFDSSRTREPLEFVLGKGNLIPGFENAVIGSTQGETVAVVISPEEGYGQRSEELVLTLPLSEIPEDLLPELGMMLRLTVEGGELDVIVTELTDEHIQLDGNHPLAGKTLNFSIEILSAKSA